jgi:hypothetical protein
MRWTRRAGKTMIASIAAQPCNARCKTGAVHQAPLPFESETSVMRQIDLHKLADDARFNRFHGLVLFWCALIIVFDG